METLLFAPFKTILSGLFVGIAFGFLLRKSYVTRFDTIVNQMLLKDFTVMKVMLTAIAFGSMGIYTIISFLPSHQLIISPTPLFASALGGGIFGIGMAIMGYCPGTGIGALADGARDMWFGVLGMIAGAALYAELFPWITTHIKSSSDNTTITVPSLLGSSSWLIIGFAFLMLILLAVLDRRGNK